MFFGIAIFLPYISENNVDHRGTVGITVSHSVLF